MADHLSAGAQTPSHPVPAWSTQAQFRRPSFSSKGAVYKRFNCPGSNSSNPSRTSASSDFDLWELLAPAAEPIHIWFQSHGSMRVTGGLDSETGQWPRGVVVERPTSSEANGSGIPSTKGPQFTSHGASVWSDALQRPVAIPGSALWVLACLVYEVEVGVASDAMPEDVKGWLLRAQHMVAEIIGVESSEAALRELPIPRNSQRSLASWFRSRGLPAPPASHEANEEAPDRRERKE